MVGLARKNRRLLRCSIALLFTAAVLHAQAQAPQLPSAIRARLDTEYPGWKLAEVSPGAYEDYRYHRFRVRPNLIWGDFDGDGKRDYAVAIEHPGHLRPELVVIAFLRRGRSFHSYTLEASAASPTTYLWPHSQGEKGFDFNLNKYFVYAHDAVGVAYGEVAGVSYLFEHGAFRKIVSSD